MPEKRQKPTVEPSEIKPSDRMIEEIAKQENDLLQMIREFAGTKIEIELARQAQMRNPPISAEEFMLIAQKHRGLDQSLRGRIDDLVNAHVETIKQLSKEAAER